MTFSEWWKHVEGWKTEGGSGEHKARAAWEHQQLIIERLLVACEVMVSAFKNQPDDMAGYELDAIKIAEIAIAAAKEPAP